MVICLAGTDCGGTRPSKERCQAILQMPRIFWRRTIDLDAPELSSACQSHMEDYIGNRLTLVCFDFRCYIGQKKAFLLKEADKILPRLVDFARVERRL